MEQKLNPGDNFPHINLDIVGGESLQIPQDLGGQFNIVLFYRGHWWPYCRRLLAGYEALIDQFKELGIKNLYNVDKDTYAHDDMFFSHRRESKKLKNTGRMINIIAFND